MNTSGSGNRIASQERKPAADIVNSLQHNGQLTPSAVQEAIQFRRNKFESQYDFLVETLLRGDSSAVHVILTGMRHCISALTKENHEILTAFLKLKWSVYTKDVCEAHISLMEHMVSAHSAMVRPVLTAIVRNFIPVTEQIQFDSSSDDSSSEDEAPTLTIDQFDIYHNAHEALIRVTQVVPGCLTTLLEVLKEHFPHRRRSALANEKYLRNFLTVFLYIPVLRNQILRFAMHRLVKLDVEIVEQLSKMDDSDDEEEDEEEPESESDKETNPADKSEIMSEGGSGGRDSVCSTGHVQDEQLVLVIDNNTAEGIDVGCVNQDENQAAIAIEQDIDTQPTIPTTNLSEMAHKLDRMMCVMFEYLQHSVTPLEGETEKETTARVNLLFVAMLGAFEDVLLPTFQSKYVQFLVFKMCSLDEANTHTFVKFLEKRLYNPRANPVERIAAAAYIGGIVTRHEMVTAQTAALALRHMSDFVNNYIDIYDDRVGMNNENMDLSQHRVFYGVCQAVMYILCFRHEAVLKDFGHGWVRRLRLDKMVGCNLNPLRAVLMEVVQEFARIMKKNELVYCYSVISRNNTMLASKRVTGSGEFSALDSFFPFDPYPLPDSTIYVSHYVQWRESDGDAELDSYTEMLDEVGNGVITGSDDEDENEVSVSSRQNNGRENNVTWLSELGIGTSDADDALGDEDMDAVEESDEAAFDMAFHRTAPFSRSNSFKSVSSRSASRSSSRFADAARIVTRELHPAYKVNQAFH
eukprot:CFRG3112T1